jgi:hypothetical protein
MAFPVRKPIMVGSIVEPPLGPSEVNDEAEEQRQKWMAVIASPDYGPQVARCGVERNAGHLGLCRQAPVGAKQNETHSVVAQLRNRALDAEN